MQSENMNKRKIIYILLAVFVAGAIWWYVDEFSNDGGPRTIEWTVTDIPITYTNEDDLADRGLMVLEEGTSVSVDLTVEGPRRQVVQLDREDIDIKVNLANVDRAGSRLLTYQIDFSDDHFSTDMVKKRSISQATVVISELNSRTVDIRCELVGNVAEGYSAGQLQLSQDTLEIRGQPEDIDPVSYVKVVLDLGDGAVETVAQDLTFLYYDANDQILDGTNIHPTVNSVQAKLPVYMTKELKLVVDFQEAPGARVSNLKYEIKPETIVVSGDAATLRNLDSITLGALDLLDLRNNNTSSHTYPIIIPDGCQNLSGVTRATMEIGFKDMSSARVITELFTYSNLPSGKNVEILTKQLIVTIFGTEEDVAAVTSENISVTADLTNYSAASGTYTVPAVIEVATPGDVGVVGSYQVQVTIHDPADKPVEDKPETQAPTHPETESTTE